MLPTAQLFSFYFPTSSEIGFICHINFFSLQLFLNVLCSFPHLFLRNSHFFFYPIFFSDEMPVFSSCIVIFMVLLTAWLHLCKVAEGFLFTRGFFCHHVEPVGFCGLSGLWGQMLLWVGIWLALRFSMDITCSLGLGRKPVSTGHPGAGRQPLCRWF